MHDLHVAVCVCVRVYISIFLDKTYIDNYSYIHVYSIYSCTCYSVCLNTTSAVLIIAIYSLEGFNLCAYFLNNAHFNMKVVYGEF